MGKQADSDGRSLLERLKDTVGRELVFQSPDPISSSSIRQYALAIGDFNPLYTDQEFANAHGLKDVMAPPTLVCDTWQYIESDSERNLDDRGDLVGRGGRWRDCAPVTSTSSFVPSTQTMSLRPARWSRTCTSALAVPAR